MNLFIQYNCMCSSSPPTIDFISQDEWDILSCLNARLHIFYVVAIELPSC